MKVQHFTQQNLSNGKLTLRFCCTLMLISACTEHALFPLKTVFLFSVPIILLYRVRRAELRRASWMWIQRPRPWWRSQGRPCTVRASENQRMTRSDCKHTQLYIASIHAPPPPVYPVTNSCGFKGSLKVVCTVWFVTSVQVSGLLYRNTMDVFTFELHWSEFISSLFKNTKWRIRLKRRSLEE